VGDDFLRLLPWIFVGSFVVFAPLSILASRIFVGRFHARWLAEYPPRTPEVGAVSRHPGRIAVAGSHGNAYRAVMDSQCLHLVPTLPFRAVFGMKARSIPWSAFTVTRAKNGRASATFGTHTISGPDWLFERVPRNADSGTAA
jgi:hypothetical protein